MSPACKFTLWTVSHIHIASVMKNEKNDSDLIYTPPSFYL